MSFCSYSENSFLYYIDENKLFSFITTFTFAVIGIFLYILSAYTFFEKRKIPRAVRPTAPFGNIQEVLFQNTTLYVYLWKYYNRFKRKGLQYGGLYLFFKPSVLIVDPVILHTFFSEPCLADVYRKKSVHDYKKIVNLYSDGCLNSFLVKYNGIKNTLITDLDGKNVSTAMHNFFMETTCLAFGFQKSVGILDIVNVLLKEKISSGFKHYFYLMHPLFKRNKSTHELQNLIRNIIEYRKKNDIKEMDLIDGFSGLSNDGTFSLDQIVVELFDNFVDNIVYSCFTVLFCLYELLSNKDVQQDLIGEIRRFNKENTHITLKNLRELSYLDAVVKETLRKYPPIPLILKECKEDYKLPEFGLELPKGSFMVASIFGVHYDPLNFTDPQKFNPDRFSGDNINFIKPNTYIPFGTDLRKEIGFQFTTLHIKLGLISILSSFNVNLDKNRFLEFDNRKLTVSPKGPLPLNFEPL